MTPDPAPLRAAHTEEHKALLWQTRMVLTGADSVLSLIFHRYRSGLPEDVQRDIEATYLDCRKQAERLQREESP